MERRTKKQLRQVIIKQRNKLNHSELITAAEAISTTAISNQAFYRRLSSAKHILSYSAFQGEISPDHLTSNLTAKVYLPKITDYKSKQMQFFSADQTQIKNRYGILEPIGADKPAEITTFDVILVPLVAFDQYANRIGMGAGFYDRVLTGMNKDTVSIGLAHDFQKVASIQPDVWDVPINVILTNHELTDPNKLFHS